MYDREAGDPEEAFVPPYRGTETRIDDATGAKGLSQDVFLTPYVRALTDGSREYLLISTEVVHSIDGDASKRSVHVDFMVGLSHGSELASSRCWKYRNGCKSRYDCGVVPVCVRQGIDDLKRSVNGAALPPMLGAKPVVEHGAEESTIGGPSDRQFEAYLGNPVGALGKRLPVVQLHHGAHDCQAQAMVVAGALP